MFASLPFLLFAALLGVAGADELRPDRKTVCSITVNSPDEQAMFRRYLPTDGFQFIELVERGRADWLASACRRQIRCDVLITARTAGSRPKAILADLIDEQRPRIQEDLLAERTTATGRVAKLAEHPIAVVSSCAR